MTKVLLELFSGTGSVGKVAKKMGYNVISVDNIEKFKPTILTDILKWDYKNDKTLPAKIDFIWASPPCTSFSILNNSMKEPHRDIKTLKPLTETGRLGNKLLNKTIQIINYFKKKNPDLKFTIENPKGYMRQMPQMKKYIMNTTSYGAYGFKYNKATDFWSNFNMKLKPELTKDQIAKCPEKAKNQSKETLYRIPGRLVKNILTDSTKNIKDDKKKSPQDTHRMPIWTFRI